MADNDARLKLKLDRIRFRAWRRGFREADLVLGPFADRIGPELSEAELAAFEHLLEADDHPLYSWIIGEVATPAEYDGPLMRRIQTFMAEHVAAAVAEGVG